jgi:tRNA(Ile)-lysidine synthase
VLERVLHTIERLHLLEPGQRVGVAVSGGADSVCLLFVLQELAPRMRWRLTVLHLDHGLRGAESRADAEFVAGLADQLGLPLLLRAADLTGGGNLEQAGRDARMAFFRELIVSGTVDRVAVGHTRSDQAETVLYRFLRGSGTAGLAGIRPTVSPGIVRPLIEMERAEVEEWLRARGIGWREDSTNRTDRFARNRIRRHLLPQLQEEWNASLPEVLAHTAEWAREEEAYWADEIQRLAPRLLVEREGAVLIPAQAVMALPRAVARRLVRHAIGLARGGLRSIDYRHVETALELATSGRGEGRCSLPGLEVCRSLDWVRFGQPLKPGVYRFWVTPPASIRIPGTRSAISLELIEKTETSGLSDRVYNDEVGYLDWDRLSGSLELRNWQPGDQFEPVGSAGAKKMKILFQQGRVPVWERSSWPVLLDRSALVWTRRFGPAAGFAAGKSTRILLSIRETGCVSVNSESEQSGTASKKV